MSSIDYKSIYKKFNEDIVGNNAITYHRTPLKMNGKGGKFSTYNLPQDINGLLKNNPILLAWSDDITNATKKDQTLTAARSVSLNKYVNGNLFDDGKSRLLNDPNTEYQIEDEAIELKKGDTFYKVESGFDTFKNVSWGFRTGSGDMYGRGFYSCFKVGIVNKSSGGNKAYGGLLLKFQVSNLSNYLFVDFNEFKKTPRYKENSTRYSEDNYIFMQLQDAGVPFDKIAMLERRCGFNISNQNIIEIYGRDRFAVDFAPYFEGFIYTGGSADGDVLVTFDLEWIAKNYAENQGLIDRPSSKKKNGAKKTSDSNIRSNLMNALAKSLTNRPEEKSKIENLIRNYDNMKSIYPVEFSIDDGQTWYKIPVSDTIKEKIFALRNAYSANNIKITQANINVDDILKAYTYNDEFNIPFTYFKQGTLTIDDIISYVNTKQNLKVVYLNGQKEDYYKNFNLILDKLNGNISAFYLKSAGSDFVVTKSSDIEKETINRIRQLNCTLMLDEEVDTIVANKEPIDLNVLNGVTTNKTDLTFEYCDYDNSNTIEPTFVEVPDDFTIDYVTTVKLNSHLSDIGLNSIEHIFKNVKYIMYSYNSSKNEYDNVIDLVKASTTIRKEPRSFGAFKKFSILKRLKFINLNIKDKNGVAPNLNNLFTEESVTDLVSYLSDNKHKIRIEDVVLSCAKDKALHREVSTFVSDNNVLINNLSLIGDFKVIGNKRTYVNNCCVDYAAFNAIKNNIAVLESMHVYMPDVPGKKIKITNEFLDSLKKICKFPYPYVYFKGGKIESQYDISELTPENDTFFRKICAKTADWNFYKYVNLSKADVIEA